MHLRDIRFNWPTLELYCVRRVKSGGEITCTELHTDPDPNKKAIPAPIMAGMADV